MKCTAAFFTFAVLVVSARARPSRILKIPMGFLSDRNDTSCELALRKFFAFNDGTRPRDLDFNLLSRRVDWKDEYQVLNTANDLLDHEAVLALVVPSLTSSLVQLSVHRRVPLVSLRTRWFPDTYAGLTSEVSPDLLRPAFDIMRYYLWKDAHYLYSNLEGLLRLQNFQKLGFEIPERVRWSGHRVNTPDEARQVLKRLDILSSSSTLNVILDMEPDAAAQVLSDAHLAIHLEKKKFYFLLMQPTDEEFWTEYYMDGLQVTGFMIYTKSPISDESPSNTNNLYGSRTEWLLGRDSALLTMEAFKRFRQNQPEALKVQILKSKAPREKVMTNGELLNKYIRDTYLGNGSTPGPLQLNNKGQRLAYTINVIESSSSGSKKTFMWSDASGLLLMEPQFTHRKTSFNISEKTLIVSSILAPPFLAKRESQAGSKVNHNFVGFVPDLLDLLSQKLGFKYEIQLVADGRYGQAQLNGSWNGMVGQVIRHDVDMAVAPLTVTSKRQSVVDFSHPFMFTGIGMLVKKPSGSDLGEMSPGSSHFFLSPFTPKVWGFLLLAMVAVGAGHFLIGKWLARATRRLMTHELPPNSTSLLDSYWFTFGSFLLRQTRLLPNFLTNRFLSGVWWVFSFFMLTLYLTNLAALLVTSVQGTCGKGRQDLLMKKTSHSVLQEFLDDSYPNVGLVRDGATMAFFKNSKDPLHSVYGSMLHWRPDLVSRNYEEGIQAVQKGSGSYAFLMESSFGDYITKRHCGLAMMPQLLDSASYAVAFAKGSTLRDPINKAILKLNENGQLSKLQDRWWNRHGTCNSQQSNNHERENTEGQHAVQPLNLRDVLGVFYVLLCGLVLTLLILFAEAIRKSRSNRAMHMMTFPSYEGGSVRSVSEETVQVVERTAL